MHYTTIPARIRLLLFSTALLTASCKKFLEIPPAPNMITTSAVFSSDGSALSAVTSLYTTLSLSQRVTSGGLSIYAGLSADELSTTAASSITDPFLYNALNANDNTVNLNFYSFSYKAIYQCNAILQGLGTSTQLTPALKSQLTGETRVIRALLYFYLTNLFGDVPVATSTDYEVNGSLPRAPQTDVYAQIESDLKEAQALLGPAYPSAGRARPNRWTASALLARVLLYEKKYSEADTQSTEVLSAGIYSLAGNLGAVFTRNSNETIWELISDNGNTTEGSVFVPASATTRPKYQLTASLINSFEAGDNRKLAWTGLSVVGGQNYYYPYKYKARTSSPQTESEKLLRLAEVYLIRAEARAQQNNLAGALADLNTVRNRAGLSVSTAATREELLTAIEKERRTELFCEWGHRWLDLKRTGRADSVMAAEKGASWQVTDALWPVPLSEIRVNPYLTQNPGY